MAARLSDAGLGLSVRVLDHSGHLCVETEVPESVLTRADSWQELLSVLETADWFGLAVTSAGGRIAWAAVSKNAPATASGVRGHSHQL
ncbi:hypothetical protein [Streptomyces sp. NPDC091212]|uniref:hypothetical protein n=1 Tax=Streptomyces sp. NPDC091212 TaxID=3155191 RepID=UPI003440CD8F